MKSLAMACALLPCVLYAPHSHAAPHAEVKEVVLKDLPDFPGKEGLLLEVFYPPASTDEVHRHDAHAFVQPVPRLSGSRSAHSLNNYNQHINFFILGLSVSAFNAGEGRYQ